MNEPSFRRTFYHLHLENIMKSTELLNSGENPACTPKKRNSSIELLKLAAMLCIVISHVAQTLGTPRPELLYPADVFFDTVHTARTVPQFIILLFRHLGAFGNLLFFTCTAWFLCGSGRTRRSRIFQIAADVWMLSVLSLAAFFAAGFRLPWKKVFMLFFPTTFGINWYTTCYVCFLAAVPFLNNLIGRLERRELLKACLVFCAVYFGICNVAASFYYYTELVLFIALYFVVSYIRLYAPQAAENVRLNLFVFAVSTVLLFLLIFLTNALGFKSSFFERNALHWARNNNPLMILAAFSLFNLCRSKAFYSRAVNYVSSLTLFIYLIHEGLIVRECVRPRIWLELHSRFGYSHIAVLTLAFALCLFAASTAAAAVYKETLSCLTKKAAQTAEQLARNIFRRIDRLLARG